MSSPIDEKLVAHVAKLGRITLDGPDGSFNASSLAGQLGAIVEYFDKLNELDTDNVEPMAHAIELNNVLAEDVLGESLTPDEALKNAPQREGDFFRVPKILGSGS